MIFAEALLRPFRADRPYVDQDAFAALYHQTYRPVFRYIYALHGGSLTDVEDLAADTFLRAWNHRSSFQGSEDAALGWLITIARNLVFDFHRRTRHHPAAISLDHAPVAAEHDALDAGLEDEQTAAVVALLSQLSAGDRELLTLRYILSWPVSRIAEQLQKTPNTVSVALRRALDRAREQMSKQ